MGDREILDVSSRASSLNEASGKSSETEEEYNIVISFDDLEKEQEEEEKRKMWIKIHGNIDAPCGYYRMKRQYCYLNPNNIVVFL